MIEHRRRPGEPGDELEPQTRFGRDPGVIEGEHERRHRTPVHLFMRPVAAVDAHDVGVIADRLRVCGWSAELLGPVGSESLGVLRVYPALEGVGQDRVGQTTFVPRLSERQQRLGSAHHLVDRALHEQSVGLSPSSRRGVPPGDGLSYADVRPTEPRSDHAANASDCEGCHGEVTDRLTRRQLRREDQKEHRSEKHGSGPEDKRSKSGHAVQFTPVATHSAR